MDVFVHIIAINALFHVFAIFTIFHDFSCFLHVKNAKKSIFHEKGHFLCWRSFLTLRLLPVFLSKVSFGKKSIFHEKKMSKT